MIAHVPYYMVTYLPTLLIHTDDEAMVARRTREKIAPVTGIAVLPIPSRIDIPHQSDGQVPPSTDPALC